MIGLPIFLATALIGCVPEGPPFTNVQAITIQQISPNGLTKRDVESPKLLREMSSCLYTTQKVNEEHSQKRNLLQTTYLVDIKDNSGIRSFELFTDQHLKGNKGNYYFNKCFYTLITQS